MISDRCEFNDFVNQAQGRDYQEIICLAEREATEAQRCAIHFAASDEVKALGGYEYAECLKDFIRFMRYGLKPVCMRQDILQRFDHIRKEALQIEPAPRSSH